MDISSREILSQQRVQTLSDGELNALTDGLSDKVKDNWSKRSVQGGVMQSNMVPNSNCEPGTRGCVASQGEGSQFNHGDDWLSWISGWGKRAEINNSEVSFCTHSLCTLSVCTLCVGRVRGGKILISWSKNEHLTSSSPDWSHNHTIMQLLWVQYELPVMFTGYVRYSLTTLLKHTGG